MCHTGLVNTHATASRATTPHHRNIIYTTTTFLFVTTKAFRSEMFSAIQRHTARGGLCRIQNASHIHRDAANNVMK